jgi:hypothetical protein
MKYINKCNDQELLDTLLLLRFGSKEYDIKHKPILNYTSIAKVMHMSIVTVRYLVLLAVRLKEKGLTAT